MLSRLHSLIRTQHRDLAQRRQPPSGLRHHHAVELEALGLVDRHDHHAAPTGVVDPTGPEVTFDLPGGSGRPGLAIESLQDLDHLPPANGPPKGETTAPAAPPAIDPPGRSFRLQPPPQGVPRDSPRRVGHAKIDA